MGLTYLLSEDFGAVAEEEKDDFFGSALTYFSKLKKYDELLKTINILAPAPPINIEEADIDKINLKYNMEKGEKTRDWVPRGGANPSFSDFEVMTQREYLYQNIIYKIDSFLSINKTLGIDENNDGIANSIETLISNIFKKAWELAGGLPGISKAVDQSSEDKYPIELLEIGEKMQNC